MLHINTLVNFFASRATVVAIFPSQNDTLIKQITAPREKDLQERDKAGGGDKSLIGSVYQRRGV